MAVWDPGSSVRRAALFGGGVTLQMEGGAEEDVDELVFACAADRIAELLGPAVPDGFERDLAADVEWLQGIAHLWYLSDARAMAEAFGRAASAPQGRPMRLPVERVRRALEIGERMAIPQTLGWTVFLSSIFPDQPLVNVGGILHVRGALDTELVTEVTRRVVLRSEGLHVRFTPGNPAPCMYVCPEAPRAVFRDLAPRAVFQDLAPRAVFQDLAPGAVFRDLASSAGPEAALASWAGELVREPFVLWDAPLIRVGVARISAAHHAVILAAHHGLADAQALGVTQTLWMEELGRALRSEPAGPVIPASHPELAAREASYLASHEIERDAIYWRDCVAALPRVALPAAGPSNDARSIGLNMPLLLCARIARWSAMTGFSPAALYHAATALCLAEVLGGTKVLFDTLITNRFVALPRYRHARESAADCFISTAGSRLLRSFGKRKPRSWTTWSMALSASSGYSRFSPGRTYHTRFPGASTIQVRASHHRDGEIRFASEDVYRNSLQTISLEFLLVVIADSSAGTSRLHINHRLGDVSAERAEHIGRRFLGLVEGLIGSCG